MDGSHRQGHVLICSQDWLNTWSSIKTTWKPLLTDRESNMKISKVLELIGRDGWYLVRTRGSHRQFKHRTKAGLVTVSGKPSDELAPGTLNSILKQSGLKN